MTRSSPYSTADLVGLIKRGDSVGLWQLADEGGLESDVPRADVTEFVLRSVEPGLRSGAIVAGRIYRVRTKPFEPIPEPVEQILDRIRVALAANEPDWIESDINFDVPER